jgi:transketolase
VARGGYVLLDTPAELDGGTPDVLLVATGSEVQLAVAAHEQLAAKGIGARVVSMPCREWFDAQAQSYRDQVLPPQVRARVSIEAGVAQGWREVVGDAGRIVSLEHYGASAQYTELFEKFGFTAPVVVSAAEDSIRDATRN